MSVNSLHMFLGESHGTRRFLHRSGCDIHAANSFGCNAVLWSAQGPCTSESMAWLLESGADFGVVNSNGHSALHKAAQRGRSGAVKWLASTFLFEKDADAAFFVRPDIEGNSPSDLCGMEGHESLARWIAGREYDYFVRSTSTTSGDDDLLDNDDIPSWLQKDLREAKSCTKYHGCDTELQWGAGCGVRRIALRLLGPTSTRTTTSNAIAKVKMDDLNDID